MTTHPAPSPGDPAGLLAMRRDLVHRVRREQRGAWFALLVFAAVRFGAAPVVRFGQGDNVRLAVWYYPAAMVLAFAAIGWFYLRRSDRIGVGTRIGPYLALGAVLGVITAGYEVWAILGTRPYPDFREPTVLSTLFDALVSPAGAIGLALLLLARIERSWPLLAITCAYLALLVDPDNLPDPSPWGGRDLLLGGGVLLLGGVGLALQQRIQRRPAE
ncbi:hypothetical protein J5Y04_16750 [Kitasatospora sp. RG8]|uniref:hypothetical protein n=1 Tax=Kitasatospora sp. RG8 TaxID=2820815 RepID=UPI001ADFA0A6|nr:hypothetical protein [Kitasatospora sp. RG8]MBP0451177.1 hypothetical protein [Kitasatospora sp. RG8]